MKKLILVNGKGKEYDLISVSKSPTFQIAGLGYEDATEYMKVGNGFYPLEETCKQGEIRLHLLFWNLADETYKDFAMHAKRNPLTILYENDTGVYYIPCRLKSIEKVDRRYYDKYGVPVTFVVTGKPYKVISKSQMGYLTAGKSYGDVGYTYDYTYGGDALNSVVLNSDSPVKSPCVITIFGVAENPIWRHYVDDELVESGAYTGTIPNGNYLVIDARSMPYSIIEYDRDGNVVADRYSGCDFSTERFFSIEEGRNTYTLSHTGVTATKMRVEAYIQYDTV